MPFLSFFGQFALRCINFQGSVDNFNIAHQTIPKNQKKKKKKKAGGGESQKWLLLFTLRIPYKGTTDLVVMIIKT